MYVHSLIPSRRTLNGCCGDGGYCTDVLLLRSLGFLPPAADRGQEIESRFFGRESAEMKTKLPPLTPQQERLVLENRGLVYWQAHRFDRQRARGRVDLEDLIGEGMIGLVNAARLYDPSEGFAFSTYALPAIYRRMDKFTDLEFAEMHASIQPLESREDGDEGQHGEHIPDVKAARRAEQREVAELVRWLLSRIRESDRVLIEGYFLEHMTFAQLAQRHGVSPQAIPARIRKALWKARGRVAKDTWQPIRSPAPPQPAPRPRRMTREKLAEVLKGAGISPDWRNNLLPA